MEDSEPVFARRGEGEGFYLELKNSGRLKRPCLLPTENSEEPSVVFEPDSMTYPPHIGLFLYTLVGLYAF